MEYLSYQAAADLLKLILLSQFAGLTSFGETMERLSALNAMCSPNNATRAIVAEILTVNSWANGHYWEEGEREFRPDGPVHGTLRPPIAIAGDSDGDLDSVIKSKLGGEEPDFLNFYPASRTGLGKWEFRPQDADPHPSVPHGHWEGRSSPKLDPYQGWIYEGKKQTSRESKDKIKALWNDRIFRKFALDTIKYHLEAFPYHGDWRVENPLRLPRRR